MAPPDTASTAIAAGPPRDSRWIRDFAFDGVFLLGSTFLVFVVAQAFSGRGGGGNLLRMTGAAEALNLVVPVLLGGPHIFFSVVRTYMDVDFKREHRHLLRLGPHVIAFSILYLVFHGRFDVVVNVVLYSAVFHGAAQLAHIGLRYRRKSGREAWDLAGKAFLVAVMVGPLYFVTRAVNEREFSFVGQRIWQGLAPTWAVWATGAVALVAAAYWLADGVNRRIAGGRTNWREGSILAAAWGAFWFLTSLDELDVTFQAYNAWHSVQALGILWFGMNEKWRSGKVRGPRQSRFCRDGAFGVTYLAGVLFSLAIGFLVLLYGNFRFDDLTASHGYYVFAITVLLNHHLMDYWVFFGKRAFDY
jgi:hypothetical protein